MLEEIVWIQDMILGYFTVEIKTCQFLLILKCILSKVDEY